VAEQFAFQTSGKTLVKQDAHGRGAPPWLLQGRDGLLTGNGRDVLEELRKGLPRFELVQQGHQRHTRTDEDGCAAHDLRVAVNNRLAVLQFLEAADADPRSGKVRSALAEAAR